MTASSKAADAIARVLHDCSFGMPECAGHAESIVDAISRNEIPGVTLSPPTPPTGVEVTDDYAWSVAWGFISRLTGDPVSPKFPTPTESERTRITEAMRAALTSFVEKAKGA